MLDIFNNDAFSTVTLTDAVNKLPEVPGQVGRLGVFESKGVATTSIAVEGKAGVLSLIQSSARGSDAAQFAPGARSIRSFAVPHLALETQILPDEVQNVRLFGSNDQLETVQYVVNERLAQMVAAHDATVEYGRIGAIKGKILDADGTEIYDLFTEFGVTQQVVSFALGTATTDVRGKCVASARAVEAELGASPYTKLVALAGKGFMDKLADHPKVSKAFEGYQAAMEKIGGDVRSGFTFGGIEFVEYRGNVGGNAFVADDEAYVLPVGVPGLFRTVYAPADFAETVNTIGLPRYAKVAVDPMFGRFVKVHTQSNPLSLCLRPRAVVKCTL